VQADARAGLDVGEQGLLVQEQDQARPLLEVGGGGALADELPGLGQEFVRKAGAVERGRAGQGDDP
jgi:hypothetical protein